VMPMKRVSFSSLPAAPHFSTPSSASIAARSRGSRGYDVEHVERSVRSRFRLASSWRFASSPLRAAILVAGRPRRGGWPSAGPRAPRSCLAVVVRGVDVGEAEVDARDSTPPPSSSSCRPGTAAAAEASSGTWTPVAPNARVGSLAGRSEGLGAERAEGRRPQESATGDAHRVPPSRRTASAGSYRSFGAALSLPAT
jgi:hypothetical protein